MDPELGEILFTEEQMKDRIKAIGEELTRDYQGREVLVIVILRGAVVFLADLTRALDLDVTIDFIVVTRYGYSDKPGQLKILKDLDYPIEGKDTIIVEDIMDEGFTLYYLKEALLLRRPASLKICTLFDKPSRRKADITPDYVGFTVPNEFIAGFGLDYKQKYRNLPYLTVIKKEHRV